MIVFFFLFFLFFSLLFFTLLFFTFSIWTPRVQHHVTHNGHTRPKDAHTQ